MAARTHAYWKGHVRLSLVTFPVMLYAAVSDSQKVKLHKITRGSGERVHYKDTTASEGDIEKTDIVKGYEYKKGHYVEIEDEELKKLKVESTHTIDLVQFTDMADIDPIYFDKPYFMVPDGKLAMEAFITVREALRQTRKLALGQITINGRERIGALKPCGKGIILETLRYAYEIRKAGQYFEDVKDVKPNKDQLDLAGQLIQAKAKTFDPASFKDTYQEGLMEIIKAKMNHRAVKLPAAAPEPDNVVNIMDALKRSLAQSGGAKTAKKTPAKKKTAAKSAAKAKPKPKKKAA